MEYKDYDKVREVEKVMEYGKWSGEIPYIAFPSDWQVQILPPFAGTIVRFKIKKGDAIVSIYLDCYDRFGHYEKPYGQPHWEVFSQGDDVFRCDMEDTESLLKAITESIAKQ